MPLGGQKLSSLSNVGALIIIRVGIWGFLIIIVVQYTPNPILIIQAPILMRMVSIVGRVKLGFDPKKP